MTITEQTIRRVATAIDIGATRDEVRDMLLEAGLTEEQAYLAYQAGKLYASGMRETGRAETC